MSNYFELYGLPESFEIDLASLSATYQQLQRLTHPDKFAGQSEQQQRIALQKNAQVSDGFQALKSPVRRAEHLLSLRGIELAGETQTMQDMDFLMQQMHWREMLADIQESDDPEQIIDDLNEEVDQQLLMLNKRLVDALKVNDEANNQQAADDVRKMKFILKLQSEVAEKEEQLFS